MAIPAVKPSPSPNHHGIHSLEQHPTDGPLSRGDNPLPHTSKYGKAIETRLSGTLSFVLDLRSWVRDLLSELLKEFKSCKEDMISGVFVVCIVYGTS
ncbi:hypothetical protein CEXT_66531 [Caerostris extrusa]|uniref:Uncharacterized protein n=1 Tax=Caerostris extrusa TaxID=172846 RepID=A0AAV4XTV2_CAEEX|nr:hypothetical protein CEXT_66531 [Caerostris extrusa]